MSSTTGYEIILKQNGQTTRIPLQEMTIEELQALLTAINEEIVEREWEETLESEESIAYWEKRSQELDQEIRAGKITEWIIPL